MFGKAPFEIGDTYWREAGRAKEERVECPMCSGAKYVTVTLGTGATYTVECEACQLGYRGPEGTILQYDLTPRAERFIIDRVVEWRDDRWRVGSGERVIDFDSLYKNEVEALIASEKRAEKLEESNMADRRKKKYGKVSSWKIQYHKRQIAEFEKQIRWHQAKIDAKKAQEEKK